MSQQPDISIITINYNGLEETCQLIESLQQYPQDCSYELIVVDNGSIQNEALLLQKKYPEVHVIRSEQNINNDTLVTANDLKYLYERLYSSPVIGAVSPKIKFAFPPQHIQFAGFTPLSKYTLRNRTIGYNETDEGQFDIPQETSYLHGAAMMIKREVIEQVGRMPEIYFLYYEEMDWCTQMSRQGYQLWYEPRCTIFHKESRSTGQDSPLKTYYLTRNRLLYAWRNRQGRTLYISILYQLLMANPKNITMHLLHGRLLQVEAIFKGCRDFFLLKHKRENI
ncbi:MAG: glycosyl transferase [Butyricimonas synergistica]|nr:MAG: glycosyl transferase [Butyricimonas synergistica]